MRILMAVIFALTLSASMAACKSSPEPAYATPTPEAKAAGARTNTGQSEQKVRESIRATIQAGFEEISTPTPDGEDAEDAEDAETTEQATKHPAGNTAPGDSQHGRDKNPEASQRTGAATSGNPGAATSGHPGRRSSNRTDAGASRRVAPPRGSATRSSRSS